MTSPALLEEAAVTGARLACVALHNRFCLFEIGISPEWLSLTNRPCTGWDMSAIQIMGFGLAIIWAASFVFLGYLLLPRRSELDQSN
jgi:hypothetical protein